MTLISYLFVALPSSREGSLLQNRDKIEESFTWKYFSMITHCKQGLTFIKGASLSQSIVAKYPQMKRTYLFRGDDLLEDGRSNIGGGANGAGGEAGNDEGRREAARRQGEDSARDGETASDDVRARPDRPGDLAPERKRERRE